MREKKESSWSKKHPKTVALVKRLCKKGSTMKTIYGILIVSVIVGCMVEAPARAVYEPSVHLLIKRGPVRKPIESRDQMRDRIARAYGIDPLEFRAMEHIESGGRNSATRFESGEVKRARRLAPNANAAEIKYLATSHCSMQVMGWHEIERGLKRGSLKDQEICYEVAAHVRAKCEERRPGKGSACYNGSQKYAGLVRAVMLKIKRG